MTKKPKEKAPSAAQLMQELSGIGERLDELSGIGDRLDELETAFAKSQASSENIASSLSAIRSMLTGERSQKAPQLPEQRRRALSANYTHRSLHSRAARKFGMENDEWRALCEWSKTLPDPDLHLEPNIRSYPTFVVTELAARWRRHVLGHLDATVGPLAEPEDA